VHTLAADLEAHKESLDDKETNGRPTVGIEKTNLEKDICLKSDLIVAIGPSVHEYLITDLKKHLNEINIIRFDPGLDKELFKINANLPPDIPKMPRCLMKGRMADVLIKGVDITYEIAMQFSKTNAYPGLKFILRGFENTNLNESYTKLSKQYGNPSNIEARPFTTKIDDLESELFQTSLALMPSRCEAFGLVGLEAIAAGIPILVSNKSGLGNLLLKLADNKQLTSSKKYIEQIVIDTFDDKTKSAETWIKKIEHILNNREVAFSNAHKLRENLKKILNWESSINMLNENFKKM
jgi:glycosyltransferase involved in cell wall biosynthesis